MNRLLQSRHRKEARYPVENLSSLLQTANKIAVAMSVVLHRDCHFDSGHRRNGHHEYHAGQCLPANPRDWTPEGPGRTTAEIRVQFLLEAFFISLAGAVAE